MPSYVMSMGIHKHEWSNSDMSWSISKNPKKGKNMKTIISNLILKLAKNKIVSYIENLMTSKNVSVKSIGEKAEKAAKVCSHIAELC